MFNLLAKIFRPRRKQPTTEAVLDLLRCGYELSHIARMFDVGEETIIRLIDPPGVQ